MEIQLGVIRDKQGIYTALLESKSLNRQLAICFNSDGKLLVRICTVVNIIGDPDGSASVIVRGQTEESDTNMIRLDNIQSIYPIRDFLE